MSNAITAADNVLVTGAGGFIGSHLAEALAHTGAHVRAMTHYNARNDWGNLEFVDKDVLASMEVISGDITDGTFMRGAMRDCNIVFHLAALIAIPFSYTAPAAYVATNVTGTLNVLQAARELGTQRVVHTSTSEVYGTARFVPITEEHLLQGQSPYSATKIGADKLAESFFLSFELPVVTVRPFNTFGPRQSARAVIPTIITQALQNRPVRLGSLTPVRDLNFVADTVAGFMLAAKADSAIGQVVNLGSGQGITIGDLAHKIFGLLGQEFQIEGDPQRERPEGSEVMKLVAGADKARDLLGWTPEIGLDEGLRRTIAFLRDNQHRYKADIYNV